MGPRGILGVVLDAEQGQALVPEPLQGVVVEVEVGQFHRIPVQGLEIHAVAVVLGRDLDLAGGQVLDRLVAAPVAELELVGVPAQGPAQDLLTRQMPKMGLTPIKSLAVSTA
jgi:hypothetical protein